MNKKLKVHVVTHTHWDREWYLSFEIFRTRLLTLLDNMKANLDKYPTFKSFSLDGQTVILEDYFEVRPEKKEEILSLIREKKIDVGPWYILPDEFLITGESFIRNYLIASKTLKELNIEGIDIGYLPDMFGHAAYTPSVLKGLGLKAAILWRGVGDASRETEFIWKAPNGDEVLTVNLLHSYSNGAHFGKNILEMKGVFQKEIEGLSPHATTDNILIMNGTDHEFPLYDLPQYFGEWEKEFGDVELLHSKFSAYVEDVLSERPNLKEVKGELKSPKYEPILKDVTSTRVYIKLANFLSQKILTRYVEPLSAYLWFLGERPDGEILEYAWKLVLKSHPHDSICGCSIDDVHRDVETRLRSAKEVGLSLMADALFKLSHYVEADREKGLPILVFNPYEGRRDAVVSLYLPFKEDSDTVIIDEEGKVYESYVDKEEGLDISSSGIETVALLSQYKEIISPSKIFSSSFRRVIFYAKNLPSLGFKIFYLKEIEKEASKESDNNGEFENNYYKFSLNPDGSFNLFDKVNSIHYENLNYFEDVGDGGDEYNFSWIPNDMPIVSLGKEAKVLEIKDYGFEKIIKIYKELDLPISLTDDREKRSEILKKVPLEITYHLMRDLPRIDVEIKLTNTVEDHKLSFVVEIPEVVSHVLNDSYFGLVSHPSDFRRYDEDYTEEDISRYAMESMAVVRGEKAKIAIVTQGLHEYESHIVDERTKLNFTLLRAVGWLSRGDLTTRKGHAGPSIPTPEAQCIGTYEYKYSFNLLQKGDEEEIYAMSRDYLYPPVGFGFLNVISEKEVFIFPKVQFDAGIVLSALKVSEDRQGIAIRMFNQAKSEKKVRIETKEVIKVWNSNMKEERFDVIYEGTVGDIFIQPLEVKTVLLTKSEGRESV